MSGDSEAGHRRRVLDDGWTVAGSDPGACAGPAAIDALSWQPAIVPGTVAGALGDEVDGDGRDWWFRVAFAAEAAEPGEEVVLGLDGVATVAEVYLNGVRILASESMFAGHELDVGGLLRGENELAICCRALTPLLQGPRKPRARWRTRLVAAPNLRFYRTMLLGRAPGFAGGPAVVGPWRPVWLERRRGVVIEQVRLRAGLRGDAGELHCTARVRALAGAALPDALSMRLSGGGTSHDAQLRVVAGPGTAGTAGGSMVIAEVEPWWPHTHGTPALYDVLIAAEGTDLHHARVGFRRLEAAADLEADGPALRINGQPVFARGAVWTPPSLREPLSTAESCRPLLDRVVAAGMNMVRVPGIGAYESPAFHDACDELGILVWQDFMFANLDYPESDPAFMATVEHEARAVLHALGPRPSLAVLCGGSEIAQQVAMMGRDPALADGPLYAELLPAVVAEAGVQAPYLPSTPWGGDLPFRTDRGVAHYYGVGAYLRPLEDARRAEVRFAAECLAFANVPDEAALAPLSGHGGVAVGGTAWKAGVPRDAGAGWDFDDVRDHYLRLLFGVDPTALRATDPGRYLELSRAASAEIMAETFGEWRRPRSPCQGALVLWLKDLDPGAGWGVLDHRGEPKVAYRHLARALSPVAVWMTDEGLGGYDLHVANDRGQPWRGRLRVALYRDLSLLAEETVVPLELGPHDGWRGNVEAVLGRFVDVSWAYRFGPAAHDLVAVSLQRDDDGAGTEPISQAFRFPAGRPVVAEPPERLGLAGRLSRDDGGERRLTVTSQRFADGVRVRVPGYVPGDDAFGLEPGHARVLTLRATGCAGGDPADGTLTALNLTGSVRLTSDEP